MAVEQAIIIRFNYVLNDLKPFYDLSDKLRSAINKSNLGEYDGHEMAIDRIDGLFFIYGPDVKRLYELISLL